MSEPGKGLQDYYDPEAEVEGDFKPAKVLAEVKVVTGEEDEAERAKFRTKLYRWHDGQWKERGTGEFKFLQHKTTGKCRAVMRQDRTLKVVANFFVTSQAPLCQLQPQKTTDKAWLWSCCDFSDGEAKVEKLCGRLTTAEEFARFREEFEKAKEENAKLEKDEPEPAGKEEPGKEKEKAAGKDAPEPAGEAAK